MLNVKFVLPPLFKVPSGVRGFEYIYLYIYQPTVLSLSLAMDQMANLIHYLPRALNAAQVNPSEPLIMAEEDVQEEHTLDNPVSDGSEDDESSSDTSGYECGDIPPWSMLRDLAKLKEVRNQSH
jgi:hypothetical protein